MSMSPCISPREVVHEVTIASQAGTAGRMSAKPTPERGLNSCKMFKPSPPTPPSADIGEGENVQLQLRVTQHDHQITAFRHSSLWWNKVATITITPGTLWSALHWEKSMHHTQSSTT
jgi:hypothetical protein